MEEDDDSKIFPQRLMEILSDECYNDSISWLPHGRAFVIKNRKLFGETVMPKYFSRKAKYSSFTRKLNRWYVPISLLDESLPESFCCDQRKSASILEDSPRFNLLTSYLFLIYRNFVRVSGGPELGAYYHEFFLRDKPQLAAQMFCKNARSKLAMAAMSESEPKPAPVVTPTPVVVTQAQATPTSAFMEAIRHKFPEQHNNNNNNQFKAFPSYGNSTLQLLQRQLEMMQQEQSNNHFELLQQERTRMLLEQAQASSYPAQMQQQKQQSSNGQESRLLQMQQLMQMQMQQRQGRIPTNPRASAA